MATNFDEVNNCIESSPCKSIAASSIDEDQYEMEKEDYLVFLTPSIVRNYLA